MRMSSTVSISPALVPVRILLSLITPSPQYSSVFHHDGPFDACAPSRNKHKAKAPMYAWTPAELAQQPASQGGAYPSAYAYGAFSNDYPEPPKKKVDAIAEAWGMHEPEPFEEFFAGGGTGKQDGDTPGSSIYNGKTSNSRSRDETRGNNTSRQAANANAPRRAAVPPPQPIFVAEGQDGDWQAPAGSPGLPKRSKSLMQRIRKMRDSPNVPVGQEYETPPSPSTPTGAPPTDASNRPTHKSQNSFLGRFGVKNQSAPLTSMYEEQQPYNLIDNQGSRDKALPATPPAGSRYPQSANQVTRSGYTESPHQQSGAQLDRRTSLIKKVGKAVRGK